MKVTLLKDHNHAGADYAAGAEIDVPDSDATWLIEQGVAKKGDKPVEPVTVRQAAAYFAKEAE